MKPILRILGIAAICYLMCSCAHKPAHSFVHPKYSNEELLAAPGKILLVFEGDLNNQQLKRREQAIFGEEWIQVLFNDGLVFECKRNVQSEPVVIPLQKANSLHVRYVTKQPRTLGQRRCKGEIYYIMSAKLGNSPMIKVRTYLDGPIEDKVRVWVKVEDIQTITMDKSYSSRDFGILLSAHATMDGMPQRTDSIVEDE